MPRRRGGKKRKAGGGGYTLQLDRRKSTASCSEYATKSPAVDPYDDASFEAWWLKLLIEADGIDSEDKTKTHKPISVILREDGMKKLVRDLLVWTTLSSSDKRRDKLTLEFIIGEFQKVGVDIREFRTDIEGTFEKWHRGEFLKAMWVYTIRFKQNGCAKCGEEIINLLFGGCGYDSNHLKDDRARTDEERTKWFDVSSKNFGRCFVDIVWEMCKTRLECGACHNRYDAEHQDAVSTIIHGTNYPAEARPPCVTQNTAECANLLRCVNSMIEDENLLSMSYSTLKSKIDSETIFDSRDAITFSEKAWNSYKNVSSRQHKLKRIYLQGEKRLCGPCWKCKKTFARMSSMDGHHLLEPKKAFNPTEGAKKDLGEARYENRKTFIACHPCHMIVTHDKDERDAFLVSVAEAGYQINEATGQIEHSHS